MAKNQIRIDQFINKSLGEWKSIRSTHSLAFQEFENSRSKIVIREIDIHKKKVVELLEKYRLEDQPNTISISISWETISDWEEDQKSKKDQTILLFIPKGINDGIVLRNKGYAESTISSSEYLIDKNNNLNLKTIYNSTVSEERIGFLSTHVRSRYSVIRNQENNSVIQTSHTSEIRNISTLKDNLSQKGWGICDGSIYNGIKTPNLVNKFIYGSDSSKGLNDKKYRKDGNKIGEEKVALNINNMPRHNHGGKTDEHGHKHKVTDFTTINSPGKAYSMANFNKESSEDGYNNSVLRAKTHTREEDTIHKHNSETAGNSVPHDNMPPYIKLIYIMKL